MSVLTWGERPHGVWLLEVVDKVRVTDATTSFHDGCNSTSRADPPPPCHPGRRRAAASVFRMRPFPPHAGGFKSCRATAPRPAPTGAHLNQSNSRRPSPRPRQVRRPSRGARSPAPSTRCRYRVEPPPPCRTVPCRPVRDNRVVKAESAAPPRPGRRPLAAPIRKGALVQPSSRLAAVLRHRLRSGRVRGRAPLHG